MGKPALKQILLDILAEDSNLSIGKKQSWGVGVRETCAEADLLDGHLIRGQ